MPRQVLPWRNAPAAANAPCIIHAVRVGQQAEQLHDMACGSREGGRRVIMHSRRA